MTIITLALLSVSVLLATRVLSDHALSRLEEKIDVSIYLKPELGDEQIQGMKRDIERSVAGVKSVDLISSAEALQRFKEKHENNELITESLLELGENPLGATLVVKASTELVYQEVLRQLESERFAPLIQQARFDDYRRVIEAMATLSSRLTYVGGIISLAFMLIMLLVVFNAIRINIYTHREEISIMRLVGASNWFIRGPFWVESVLYAGTATLLTGVLFFPILSFVQPYVDSFFSGYGFDLVKHFSTNSVFYFGLEFAGAALLNVGASTVAMRRYLKV